jgi:hypothetical protein
MPLTNTRAEVESRRPSRREELTSGANLGLPREALGFVGEVRVAPPTGGEGSGGGGSERGEAGDRGDERGNGGGGAAVDTRSFSCGSCGKTLTLTPTQILKHRRSCGK